MPARALKTALPSDLSIGTTTPLVGIAPSAQAPLDAAPSVGGVVGEMHRTLNDRIAPVLPALEPLAVPLDERMIRFASRAAGFVLLAAGFAGVAWLIF